jgi:hypothetical protein
MRDNYIVVKDRYPRISEVLNDCVSLCFPTYRGETLASILKKICAKITANYDQLSEEILELQESGALVFLEEGDNITITGSGTQNDPYTISTDSESTFIEQGTGITITGSGTEESPYVINTSITQYSDEQSQDAVGNILTNTSSVVFSYIDGTPTISAIVPSAWVRGLFSQGTGISYDSSTGVISSTVNGTVTSINITQPAAGITASGGPVTASGSITLTLANDLAALEALSGTGIARRTGSDTWTVGTIVSLAEGGTGASLSDPGTDRILFWDDSTGVVTWLELGTNLSITGTTINASGGGSSSVSTTFDATSDWGSPTGGYYSFVFAHALTSDDISVFVWDETGTPVQVFPEVIERTDNNTVTIKVTDSPDNRFAGRIVINS